MRKTCAGVVNQTPSTAYKERCGAVSFRYPAVRCCKLCPKLDERYRTVYVGKISTLKRYNSFSRNFYFLSKSVFKNKVAAVNARHFNFLVFQRSCLNRLVFKIYM